MKLIFVYNANGGFFNVAADMAHKIFSPATYPCSLCDLTYGVLSIRPEWADFIRQSPVAFKFWHKEEFHSAHPAWSAMALPLVLADKNGQLDLLISADELHGLQSIGELKKMVSERTQHFSL